MTNKQAAEKMYPYMKTGVIGATRFNELRDMAREAFLAGCSFVEENRWIRLDRLQQPFTGVVMTMMANGRVFAYDTDYALKGLKEVAKHHPEALCLQITKPTPPIKQQP